MGRVCSSDDAMAAIQLIADEGCYQKEAALRLGVDYWSLCRMLATPEFKPLADQARIGAAEAQEALAYAALNAIRDDDTQAATTRQVRLSELHLKSAAVRDPRSYGQRVQVEQSVKLSLSGILSDMSQRVIDVTESIPAISGFVQADQESE